METRCNVLVLDYGTGNLNSVIRAVNRIGIQGSISSRPEDVRVADKLILPGVGHFGKAMSRLRELGLRDALDEAVLKQGKPVLGICLGMELMASRSEEGNADGFGWIDAEMVRFSMPPESRFKVPHMGWNTITRRKNSGLLQGLDDASELYFAHSYHLKVKDQSDVLCETDYGIAFPSAVERGNIFGVQFHPEKSHDAGARLLRNFVEM